MIRSVMETNMGNVPLEVRLAKNSKEVEKALRLRYQVFVEEEQANLVNDLLIEQDEYDPYCDHLIVLRLDNHEVIGTYRLLSGRKAKKGIGFYSETEFDLALLQPWMAQTVELGRSCVVKEHRNGRVISLLWEGIAKYILENKFQYLIGCASIADDQIRDINEIYSYLKQYHNFGEFQITPKDTHKIYDLKETELKTEAKQIFRQLPPLLKGYLRAGAYIGGEPANDPVFGTNDFFLILEKDKIVKRYQQNYLKAN